MQQTQRKVRNFIGGEWIEGDGRDTEPVYDPATGEVIAETPLSTTEDVDRAVQRAKEAFPSWAATPVTERARLLFRFKITAASELELAVCKAPGGGDHRARLIPPDDVASGTRGKGTNVRHVHDILPEGEPAHSLLVVEVITPGGHWSSYPSHKHDADNLPDESLLEEVYYHRLDPPQGFGFQRVYTDDRSLDETMTVEDGDVTLVPRGYHPCAAAHGYDLYYLNVMAGPKRVWRFNTEPAHCWLLQG